MAQPLILCACSNPSLLGRGPSVAAAAATQQPPLAFLPPVPSQSLPSLLSSLPMQRFPTALLLQLPFACLPCHSFHCPPSVLSPVHLCWVLALPLWPPIASPLPVLPTAARPFPFPAYLRRVLGVAVAATPCQVLLVVRLSSSVLIDRLDLGGDGRLELGLSGGARARNRAHARFRKCNNSFPSPPSFASPSLPGFASHPPTCALASDFSATSFCSGSWM